MSGVTAMGVLAGAAVAGTAVSIYNGQQQASAQKKSMAQAKSAADKQATLADQAMNKENQKRPNTTEILDAAAQAGRGGVTGTMLTGASGVDKNTMALGRNSLLGG